MTRLTPEQIKAIRKSYQLTQQAMADVIQVSRQTYRLWEAGEVQQSPISDKLLRYIDKYGIMYAERQS